MIHVKNKFNIGDTAFCISKENKCVPFVVNSITAVVNSKGIQLSYYQKDEYTCRLEEELFESPEALKKHVFEDTLDVL
jgi:hypothetical protein